MGEKINKEYEEFQKYLDKKEKKLKLLVDFNLDDDIDKVLEELNNKKIVF
jgi:basic membrane lipoprotein Med (substrate-binding protein (PBP1-ABC) superfamily)